MKPTLITDEATQSPAEILLLAQRFDLDSVELRTVLDTPVYDLSQDQQRELRAQLRDAGLGVCCIASSAFKSDIDADHDQELEKLGRALATAVFFESPLIRVFSFWRRPHPESYHSQIVDALERAGQLAKPYGVRLAVENGKRTMHSTGRELAALMRDLDDQVFSVVWDPGNSIFGGNDLQPVTEGFPYIAAYVRHVHIKDPYVSSDGHREYVHLGMGQLDLRGQIRALREHDYDGFLSLETHWRPDRVLPETQLDYPGGESFSHTGYTATQQSLEILLDLIQTS